MFLSICFKRMQTLNVNEVEHFKCAKDCGYCKLHSRCFETVAISLNRILWFQFMLSVNLNSLVLITHS